MTTSLVMTAIGPDRPGLVKLLSDAAERYGANWAESRMASLAGQFAGMVHFEVAAENAEPLEAALRELQDAGLRIVIARSGGPHAAVASRKVNLELVGHDRPGIVRELSEALAANGVSIDELHTQVASAAMSGGHLFKVKARLAVPQSLSDGKLKAALESLTNEMMVDLELGSDASR